MAAVVFGFFFIFISILERERDMRIKHKTFVPSLFRWICSLVACGSQNYLQSFLRLHVWAHHIKRSPSYLKQILINVHGVNHVVVSLRTNVQTHENSFGSVTQTDRLKPKPESLLLEGFNENNYQLKTWVPSLTTFTWLCHQKQPMETAFRVRNLEAIQHNH